MQQPFGLQTVARSGGADASLTPAPTLPQGRARCVAPVPSRSRQPRRLPRAGRDFAGYGPCHCNEATEALRERSSPFDREVRACWRSRTPLRHGRGSRRPAGPSQSQHKSAPAHKREESVRRRAGTAPRPDRTRIAGHRRRPATALRGRDPRHPGRAPRPWPTSSRSSSRRRRSARSPPGRRAGVSPDRRP
jgi:hypothetical protein